MIYTDISENDQFKRKDNILETDFRIKNWGVASDINYFHDQLSPLFLNPKIPENIRIEFDSARNVFLYSHFSYRLTNVAAQVALSVLEKFLKFHLKENLKIELEKDTLSPLINHCLDNDIITSEFFLYSTHYNKDDQFNHKSEKARLVSYFKCLVKEKRNSLAHDSHKANIPWDNLDVLRDVSAIINFLYKDI